MSATPAKPVPAKPVLVLNPNSSPLVTAALRDVIGARGEPARFTVDRLPGAPAEIATPADHHTVAPLVVERLAGDGDRADDSGGDAGRGARHGAGPAAVIVACHGDPGVDRVRECTDVPVLGIGETSLHAAASVADRFAVLTLGTALIDRKWEQLRAAGLAERCAAVTPTDTSVAHGLAADPDLTPYRRAAERAVAGGATALVLGCAGMVTLVGPLAAEFGVPVIEPVTVTCSLAATLLPPLHPAAK